MTTREVALDGLRQGMMARVAHLFEGLANATGSGGSEADVRFRKAIMACLETYDRACTIVTECTGDKGD